MPFSNECYGAVNSQIRREVAKMRMYATVHNNAAKREKWSRVKYEVNMTQGQTEFTCECGYFEHTGMLCSHVSRVTSVDIYIPLT
uniref:SWIM-type domain-containing protein n=1 Tax=Aegilops tauschii subsp. strangulata TaxID=200361 RepID=A0A453TC94_AEGTS